MALILDLITQGSQMALVLLLAPLLLGYTRKVKARLLRRAGRPSCSPTATCCASSARRWCWRRTPRGCSAAAPT